MDGKTDGTAPEAATDGATEGPTDGEDPAGEEEGTADEGPAVGAPDGPTADRPAPPGRTRLASPKSRISVATNATTPSPTRRNGEPGAVAPGGLGASDIAESLSDTTISTDQPPVTSCNERSKCGAAALARRRSKLAAA
jgi:hypothetical protein